MDSVFAPWDRTHSPGCALGVARRGVLVLARGYGMGNLDYGIPLSPASVFYLASVSKQFTAAAVALAAEEGFLSLDDDVREYVPELPDYGRRITIRHLVHHTSGLRDYLTLMRLAGMRYGDVHPDEEILALIARQRALNFSPGDEFLYSNTGYFLLAVIVERATGMPLREFARTRIFEPLGMTSTHFHDDAGEIVPRRVISYLPGEGGGFRVAYLLNFDKVGSGGLYSSVEDLARWDRNFYEPRVGEGRLLETLLTRGVLNDGDTLDYAFGLAVREYRGLRVVEHGGSMMGFRTALVRFPDEGLTVICLCNLGTINPVRLAHRVAEVFLGERMAPPVAEEEAAPGPPEPGEEEPFPVPAGDLPRYAGRYWSPELDAVYELAVEEGRLVLRRAWEEPLPLVARGPELFRAGPLTFRFQGEGEALRTGFLLDAGRVRGLVFERR